jgi:hypothetical protein
MIFLGIGVYIASLFAYSTFSNLIGQFHTVRVLYISNE